MGEATLEPLEDGTDRRCYGIFTGHERGGRDASGPSQQIHAAAG